MAIDDATIRKIARLARIDYQSENVDKLSSDLNRIAAFIEKVKALDVTGVEPMTAVTPMPLKRRNDEPQSEHSIDAILANAPETREGFFVVPKVVE